jgi:hypothetical protein
MVKQGIHVENPHPLLLSPFSIILIFLIDRYLSARVPHGEKVTGECVGIDSQIDSQATSTLTTSSTTLFHYLISVIGTSFPFPASNGLYCSDMHIYCCE